MRHPWFRLLSISARSCTNKRMNDMSIIDEDRIRLSIRAGSGGLGILRFNGIGGDGGDVYMVGQPNFDFHDMRKRLAGIKKNRASNGQNALYTKLVATRGEDAKAAELIDILRRPEWTTSVDETIRPHRPLVFDALIPTSAKERRISDLKSKLRNIHAFVHHLSDPNEGSPSLSESTRLV